MAELIADAVLYEGYVLYPYRASAAKNRLRWQVGLVAPRTYAEATASDPWFMQAECLAEIEPGAELAVRVRCLHVQHRAVEKADAMGTEWQAVETLMVDDRQLIAWDEAVLSEFVRDRLPLDGTRQEWCLPWELEATCDREAVYDSAGQLAARVVRRRKPIAAVLRIQTEPCGRIVKIRARVENLTPCEAVTLADRDVAVRHSLAGTHAVLSVENAAFVSLLDPPRHASALAAGCINTHTFPVLVGPAGSRSTMLASPIILYDYPAVAPESPGDFCDATEIDEMLMLRVRTLTDAEKQEARATDARSAHIIDRCDAASADTMARLHGAVIAPGTRVRLEPTRCADSMDICLRGRTATVTAVYRTLEDEPYLAVTPDDDPFGASGTRYRRSLFFRPDEIIPLKGPK